MKIEYMYVLKLWVTGFSYTNLELNYGGVDRKT